VSACSRIENLHRSLAMAEERLARVLDPWWAFVHEAKHPGDAARVQKNCRADVKRAKTWIAKYEARRVAARSSRMSPAVEAAAREWATMTPAQRSACSDRRPCDGIDTCHAHIANGGAA
jgi:hypothetical protein